MYSQDGILVASAYSKTSTGEELVNHICLDPKMGNTHGFIGGATNMGKTTTVKVLAEGFSDMGVPVFLADIKGDIGNLSVPGEDTERLKARCFRMGIESFPLVGYPVQTWDVYGTMGIPVRATVSSIGPVLLARLLNLSNAQDQVLSVLFKLAADMGMPLIDCQDLQALVRYAGEHANELKLRYGSMSTQSLGSIQRNIIRLEAGGGDVFFGEPSLDINDWIATAVDGRGIVNILNCVELVKSPLLYSTLLLWMLNELMEKLPEVGNPEKPKLVLFFDEAHLIFSNIQPVLLSMIERTIKLIRSKGVGIYFITQSPADIPDSVLAQLGNRIQHALRSYTPKDQKAVRAAAASFRQNPGFDTVKVISELGTGEALISLLDGNGVPSVVERGDILPPQSYMGSACNKIVTFSESKSPLMDKYAIAIDNHKSAKHVLRTVTKSAPTNSNPKANRSKSRSQSVPEADIQGIVSGVHRFVTTNSIDDLALGAARLASQKLIDSAFNKLGRRVHRRGP